MHTLCFYVPFYASILGRNSRIVQAT